MARPLSAQPAAPPLRVAVVGGGWAGIAAAVEAVRRGHAVMLFEMAPTLGGRARRVDVDGIALDNGQHILIGAYRQTLNLMRVVGVEPERALMRVPLSLHDRHGNGLRLGDGPATLALAVAVLRRRGWSWRDRLALLAVAGGWAARGFRCDPRLTVAQLAHGLPPSVRRGLIDPLAVAALNTPVDVASAAVFLRVLRDALLGGAGSADLLLPRVPLGDLLPEPARQWLQSRGAQVRTGQRVQAIQPDGGGCVVSGHRFDAVVLAASPVESVRLAEALNPSWADLARALAHQPIATVYLSGTQPLPVPMLLLDGDAEAGPAQFAFDLAALGRERGLCAFVASAAADWVDRGVDALSAAVIAQARVIAPHAGWKLLRTLVDRRATFACTPSTVRPPAVVRPNVVAAGDYVEGPYPGTLEGAVASGLSAIRSLSSCNREFRDAK